MTLSPQDFENLTLLEKENILATRDTVMQTTILGEEVVYYKIDNYFVKVLTEKSGKRIITTIQ